MSLFWCLQLIAICRRAPPDKTSEEEWFGRSVFGEALGERSSDLQLIWQVSKNV